MNRDYKEADQLGDLVEVARLRAAVAALPQMDREVFVLHARDGLDYAAIAGRKGLEIGAVQDHLARALAQLADALDDPRR